MFSKRIFYNSKNDYNRFNKKVENDSRLYNTKLPVINFFEFFISKLCVKKVKMIGNDSALFGNYSQMSL